MAITKAKKKEIVEKISDILKKGKSFVFVNFKGLKVGDTTLMRKDLRAKGVGYLVSKKTLINRALSGIEVKGGAPKLQGEVSVAYLSKTDNADSIAPSREIFSFENKFKGAIKILGGIFEGQYLGREEMLSIATIPPQEVLYGQFLNVINSPIQGFVVALSKIAEKKN